MKKGKVVASVLLLSLVVLLAGLTDVGCGGTPVTIPVNIPIPGDYAMPNPPSILVGFPLNQSITVDIPSIDLPTPEAINTLLADQVGSFVAGLVTSMVHLDTLKIALVSLTLTATGDTNFNTLTSMAVSWLPGPVNLGSAQPVPPATGLGTEIVLAPPDGPVDLLALVTAANESGAQLRFDVAGTVPEVAPICSIKAAAEVSLNVNGLIMPMIIQWLLTSPGSPLAGLIAGALS